ncbi:MAG TPA: hypothetical protein VF625_06185 [Longimicrobium sp.]
MAEIDVERGRRNVWPWVLGLLAVAILVAALASLMNDTSAGAEPGRDTTAVPAAGV